MGFLRLEEASERALYSVAGWLVSNWQGVWQGGGLTAACLHLFSPALQRLLRPLLGSSVRSHGPVFASPVSQVSAGDVHSGWHDIRGWAAVFRMFR